MHKLNIISFYIVGTVLLLGVIFIAPDIFISRFYTFQSLWGIGGLSVVCTLFLTIKKNTTVSLNTITPLLLALIGVLLYSPTAINGIVVGLLRLVLG